MWIFRSFLEEGTKYPLEEIQRERMEQRLKERPSETPPPISYTVTKPDTIVNVKKYLLTGA